MATIVYLDVEDEITTAAARIRGADAPRVAVVVPFGSRVATSRINFRLLAREAHDVGRRLDVVAPDASARALAASAGLPVFASVTEYEAALEEGADTADAASAAPLAPAAGGPAAGGSGPRPALAPDPRPDRPAPVAAPGRPAPGPADRDTPVAASARRRRPRPLFVGVALVLAAAIGFGGAAAAIMLPRAQITVTPAMEPTSPVSLTVRAEPGASAVDPVGLVIPATTLEVPLSAKDQFAASGKDVQQTTAAGRVTFDSTNTVNAMPIPGGTRVSTADGIVFTTTAAVTVPRATVSGSTITHGLATVGVVAAAAGPAGNVAAGAIDQVSSSLAALQVSVRNGAPTTGGARTELPKVTAQDVNAATSALSRALSDQLATALSDPGLTPAGSTLYPSTSRLGDATFTPDGAGLVGRVLKAGNATFTLQASATATVTSVDESPLRGLGESALHAALKPGYQIDDGSAEVAVSEGTVGEDGIVTYVVSATALQGRPLDARALAAAVLGKSEADARTALAPYGQVSISLWPFWVRSVPSSADRVTLTVSEPTRPAPTQAPRPTPTARPSGAGAPTSGPSRAAPGGSPIPSG